MTRIPTRALAALAAAFLTLAGTATAMAQGAQPDTERYGQQKVVYHINGAGGEDNAAYKGALRNLQNHINAVGESNLEAAVVMHGNGVNLLMAAKDDDALQTTVGSLKGQGVKFLVCNNTLVGRNISWEDDLYDVWEEDIVPSGVAELSRLEGMGYTYIKP